VHRIGNGNFQFACSAVFIGDPRSHDQPLTVNNSGNGDGCACHGRGLVGSPDVCQNIADTVAEGFLGNVIGWSGVLMIERAVIGVK